jgi:hypothetical protein
MALTIAWAEMARQVEKIEAPLEEQAQQNLIVVGMDKYAISSELAFYNLDGDGMDELSGQHLFGENSLMWASWKPASAARGKLILMVAFREGDLRTPSCPRNKMNWEISADTSFACTRNLDR